MATFFLVLIWAGLGLLVGLFALAARLKPAGARRAGWSLLALGLGASLPGGWLGYWLFGRLFSNATALWIAVLVVCLPAMCELTRRWLAGGTRVI